MKPVTRKEYYLAKAAGTYTGPTPPPVLREDYYLATLSGYYSGNCPAPVTRIEKYMSAAVGLTSYVPQPITRIEKYWYAIAKGTGYVPEPVTREEKFLYAVLKNPPKPEYLDKTAEGSLILLTDSAQAPLTSLTVYGHSTQDGTPSPENPVPIVSAGDDGEINVSVSDGGTQSQTLTISTPGGLPGIPVSSGGNYTDESGQQWVCDEIDLARGKYVQRVEYTTRTLRFEYNNHRYIADTSDYADLGKYSGVEVLCTQLPFFLGAGSKFIGVRFSPDFNSIVANTEAGTNWETETPPQNITLDLLLQLATPIETDLTAEEIAAYKALHTYSPATTVSNDAGAWMKVGYKAIL